MCYYNGVRVARVEYIRLKQLEKALAELHILARPVQSGFEYGESSVLRQAGNKTDFEVVNMEWGFIPSYLRTRADVTRFREGYKDTKGLYHKGYVTLNATAEDLLLPNKIYRDAALHRRCLILSTGFFEWRHVFPIGKKGQPLKTAEKFPYYIGLPQKDYFYMAGIWQPWHDTETGEMVDTFAIITTAANRLMQQVHNSKKRMPTILTEDLAYDWLLGNPDEHRISAIAKFQYPWQEMAAIPIAKDFRTALDPTAPAKYAELPPLELAG